MLEIRITQIFIKGALKMNFEKTDRQIQEANETQEHQTHSITVLGNSINNHLITRQWL